MTMNAHSPTLGQFRPAALIAGLTVVVALVCAMPATAKPGGKGNGGTTGITFQPELRLQWRAALDGVYSLVRPAVNPVDGTVYAVDVDDNLYAFSPNPSESGEPVLQWRAAGAGSKGLDVSADGSTVYTGNESWIRAYDTSDGSLKWSFEQTPRAFILVDVAVAPNGSVCAVATSGMGIFCLEDAGPGSVHLRWQRPETYARTIVSYTEIAFGPGASGSQLYFAANGHTRSVRVSDGADVFTLGYAGPPMVSPFDGTWHRAGEAFNPDGSQLWRFDGFPLATAATTPSLGTDGTHYTTNQGVRVFALDPSGFERWQRELDEGVGGPEVDPSNHQVLLPIGAYNLPAAVRAIDAGNGADLWRTELVPPAAGVTMSIDAGMAFSPGGDTAYVLARGSASDAALNRVYLYALATDPALPNASTLLRSADVMLKGRRKAGSIACTGLVVVSDENGAPVSGALVAAAWGLPDGRQVTQTSSTGGNGEAKFNISGVGGIYTLTVEDVVKDRYAFDPANSVLSAGLALF